MDFLVSNGYVDRMSKDDYEKLLASVSEEFTKVSSEDEEAKEKERTDEESLRNNQEKIHSDEESLADAQKKIHSIRFWFEGHEKKESDREKVQADEQVLEKDKESVQPEEQTVEKDEELIHEKDDELQSLIQKKSVLDRQVPCGEYYLSLTETGVAILHDLTVRDYRVGSIDFKDFIQETKSTAMELQSIAERASHYYADIKAVISNMDTFPLAKEEEEHNDDDDDDDVKTTRHVQDKEQRG